MTQERTGVATFKGNPITLIGPELKVGDQAPDFTLSKNLVEDASLKDFAGKIKLISVVPSWILAYAMRKLVVSTWKPENSETMLLS